MRHEPNCAPAARICLPRNSHENERQHHSLRWSTPVSVCCVFHDEISSPTIRGGETVNPCQSLPAAQWMSTSIQKLQSSIMELFNNDDREITLYMWNDMTNLLGKLDRRPSPNDCQCLMTRYILESTVYMYRVSAVIG